MFLVESGFGLAPTGSPKPPVVGVGLLTLFATSVGFGLANRPTFGAGGGATAFGGAGGRTGAGLGISNFTGAGGSSSGLGGTMILGGSSFAISLTGGATIFTSGAGGLIGLGRSTGTINCVISRFTWAWWILAAANNVTSIRIEVLMPALTPKERQRPPGSSSNPKFARFKTSLVGIFFLLSAGNRRDFSRSCRHQFVSHASRMRLLPAPVVLLLLLVSTAGTKVPGSFPTIA